MQALTANFRAFLKRINPSPTYEQNASTAYNNVKQILENDEGMKELGPYIFLQGSYRRDTAIYTINDVDIVVLCQNLCYPPSGGPGRSYSRNDIFSIIAKAIRSSNLYKDKVTYTPASKCIKVMTTVRLDVLPVVRCKGHTDVQYEPIVMYHPDYDGWIKTYARYHRNHCSEKNAITDGNFIPLTKIFKHLRDNTQGLSSEVAPSFYIECLLYDIDNEKYSNPLVLAIVKVLGEIALNYTPDSVFTNGLGSPCSDRQIFSSLEWTRENYIVFHEQVINWTKIAIEALEQEDKEEAITKWKLLLGNDYFPRSTN